MASPFSATIKKFPFVRLLIFLIAGILLQWYLQFQIFVLLIAACICIVFLALFYFLSSAKQFLFRWMQGFIVLILFLFAGAIITCTKDIRHYPIWFDKIYKEDAIIKATLEEPLVDKAKSFKALATVNAIKINGAWKSTAGKILIYFRKDSTRPLLDYGSQIIFKKSLQTIFNSGNPGAFDYKRYCLFQDVQHQVFLQSNEYIILQNKNCNWLKNFLFNIRDATIATLQKNIPNSKEQGVAEALLIGYRDDLDKTLVQAYSNTGVVHIIAISGLHLGLIYGLLVWLLAPFKAQRWHRFTKPLLILLVLWIFTLVAGAVPSIMRSAVMFSFIVIGESLNRKTNVYNTLAASAFCMLLFDPFFLWDVGFQLSFAAVVSIVTFYKYVYNWFWIKNKILNFIWRLNAVTISAQILTLPLILFHFHQFPNLFLITNFIAVPLSCFILYVELFMLIIAKWSWPAGIVGKIISAFIWWMDAFIESINKLSFSLTDNIKINVVQAIFLYAFIVSVAIWLIQKSSKAFLCSLISLLFFISIRNIDVVQKIRQQKLIVYNIPQHSAMDLINGLKYKFIGDSILLENGFLKNFNLTPSRVINRTRQANDLPFVYIKNNLINSVNKKIFIVDDKLNTQNIQQKMPLDAIIISKNPHINISQIQSVFNCKEIIFDSSNPLWKIEQWKKACDSLHLRFYSVPEQGAFEMDL
ncbi:MAG: ComEC/Rec2 family competence protein [Chitinophagaceae bacterium]